jgi:hypothetical protein
MKRFLRRLKGWIARRRLERLGLNELFRARPADAIKPDALDLMFMYDLVTRNRISRVLEFGSGCSTAVLAEALRRNRASGRCGSVALLSVETDARWADATQQLLSGELASICSLQTADLSVSRDYDEPAYLHDGLPPFEPELIYVDGPPLNDSIRVAADALLYEKGLKPGALILVDGRVANVNFLRRQLRRKYRVTTSVIRHNTLFRLRA